MKILITGGSGYLASSAAYYLSNFYKIILLTRNPKKIKRISNDKIKVIKIKDYNKKDLKKNYSGCNCIIHFAGMNKTYSNKFENKAINFKKKSTKNLLKFAIKNDIKKFIYISSMQIYKNYSNKIKITEKNFVDNTSGYNNAHVEAEKIVKNFKKQISFTIIRPSSIFGFSYFSRSKELIYTILNNFCYQAKFKKSIVIEDPNTVRNFLPFSIFGKFLNEIISNKFDSKNKVINVGYKSFNLDEIAKLISQRFKKIYKKKIQIKRRQPIKNGIRKFEYLSHIKNYNFSKKIFTKEIDFLIKNIKI